MVDMYYCPLASALAPLYDKKIKIYMYTVV